MHIYAYEKDGDARFYCILDHEGGSVLWVLSLSTNFLGAATGTGSTGCGRGAESGRGFRTLTGALPGAVGKASGVADEADIFDGAGLGGIAGNGLGAGEGRCAGEELFVEDIARRAAGFGGKL